MLHALILKMTWIQGPHYTSSLSLFLASPSFSSSPLNSFPFLPLLLSSSFLVPPPSSLYLYCVSAMSADRQTLRSNRRLRERHTILLNGQIRESKVLPTLPPFLLLLLPLSLSPCNRFCFCFCFCLLLQPLQLCESSYSLLHNRCAYSTSSYLVLAKPTYLPSFLRIRPNIP